MSTPIGRVPGLASGPDGPEAGGASRMATMPAAGDGEGPATLSRYWEAGRLAATLLDEFLAAGAAGRPTEVRSRFYVLASYIRRTLAMLHAAIEARDEPLAAACLQNVLVLQHAADAMHLADPDAAPTTLALEPALHRRVNRDLVHRILRDAAQPIDAATVLRHFNELDEIGDAREPAITAALRALVALGHAATHDGRYRPGRRPYVDGNTDRAALLMLAGPGLAATLADDGFEGLSDALDRPATFSERFRGATGFGPVTADHFLAAAAAIEGPLDALAGRRRPHTDLGASAWPRPYQWELHAVLRDHGYAGQVIEAPNGCGKTMVGMLCIDDWLGELAPGQSILVLVPTVNYEQQWVGELCLTPAGLRLPPHLVHAGTPARLARLLRSEADVPAVIVTTYPAIARLASGCAGDGFDPGPLERFLQAAGVRHVILDEVHKVATDPGSPTASSVRLLLDWLHDGSLRSVVGFSGTLLELLPALTTLGLELACVLPPATLIGQGWVAPFSELGIPFSYSEREWRIAGAVDRCRSLLVAYLDSLGGRQLRAAFSAIPMAERVRLALVLGMYGGRPDREPRIIDRLTAWESGDAVGLADLGLVQIIQLANNWSDADLLLRLRREAEPSATIPPSATSSGGDGPTAGIPPAATPAGVAGPAMSLAAWVGAFDALRVELRDLLPPGRVRRRLAATGLGVTVDAAGVAALAGGGSQRPAVLGRRVKDALAGTFTGLYLGLREWSRHAGEGRVEAVRTIIAVERDARQVTGVIVFDDPAPLPWRQETVATAGYRGVAGLYLQLLADTASTPVAALATELYLPDRQDPARGSLHAAIAAWIVEEMVRRELGGVLASLVSAGAPLSAGAAAQLRSAVAQAMERYADRLLEPGRDRIPVFDREVLGTLRALRRSLRRGIELEAALRHVRLDVGDRHLRSIARSAIDYGRIARSVLEARLVPAIRADGTACALRVVPMPGGDRRQRMYDLVGRMVDSPDLPVDVVVVTSWARTGWNVRTPNVLVDATATRDVIAWQQLRGRSMRPATSWTADDQRRVEALLAAGPTASSGPTGPDGSRQASAGHGPAWVAAEHAAARVMLAHNKVAHVYELVRGHGSSPQVRRRRGDDGWERTEAIAAKHRREWSVRSVDGAYLAGPGHAPLMIGMDPRRDSPAMLRDRLARELAVGDEPTVLGWLRAATVADGAVGTGTAVGSHRASAAWPATGAGTPGVGVGGQGVGAGG